MQSEGFTPNARTALSLAERTASRMNTGYVGTEHLLVGLLKENAGVAARVLKENNADENKILEMIRELIMPDIAVAIRRTILPGRGGCWRRPTGRPTASARKRQEQSIFSWRS